MCEEMQALLNAYLDGELHGRRLREVEAHLAACAACRDELADMRRVSALLRAAPSPDFLPAGRFVARLRLQMNAQDAARQPPPGRPYPQRRVASPRSSPAWAWWLAPAALLAAWFFLRTAFTLTAAISAADMTGLLGQARAWLSGSPSEALWYSAVNGLFGSLASAEQQSALSLASQVNVFGSDLFNGFLWQAALALLYWGWLLAIRMHSSAHPAAQENAA
jgi:anti-sigma factor RsiW